MTREEAKFILAAYRADGRDCDDDVFAKALDLARKDPELAEWLAREQALDAQVSARLREVSVPAGTREAILVGLRATGGVRSRVGRPVPWIAAAAAAAVILLLVLRGGLAFKNPVAGNPAIAEKPATVSAVQPLRPQLQGLEAFVANDALMGHSPGRGEEGHKLRSLFSSSETKLGVPEPVDFDALCSTGGRTVEFNGHPVVEICFWRDATQCWYHLYILKAEEFPTLIPADGRGSGSLDGVGFAYWTDVKFHYIVAGVGDLEIQKHLF